jgi:hypothetical protein
MAVAVERLAVRQIHGVEAVRGFREQEVLEQQEVLVLRVPIMEVLEIVLLYKGAVVLAAETLTAL